MGEPIEIDKIRVGDILRVVNPMKESTFTVREITPREDGFRFIMGDPIPPATRLIPGIFGGRPGEADPFNTFFLVERPRSPSQTKHSRMLTELQLGKPQLPEDILNYKLAPLLGLKKTAKKKGGRRRKTRKSRR
jgi:hypothetical protein